MQPVQSDASTTGVPTYQSHSSSPPTYASRVPAGVASAESRRLTASLLSPRSDSSHLKEASAAGITRQLRPQYIYYRVYTEYGAVVPRNRLPLDVRGDPSLACFMSTAVAPPHSVMSLKRCLCKCEDIDVEDHARTNLYLSMSSRSPMDDGQATSILANTGLGQNPGDPLAFVINYALTARTGRFSLLPARFSPRLPAEAATRLGERYIYYRLYMEYGAVVSKNPAPSEIDSSVSCIMSALVAPPHSILSLKCCLCNYEELDINDHANTNLFLSASSRSPMDDDREASILEGSGLGSKPEDPLALVVNSCSLPNLTSLAPLPQTNKTPTPRYVYYRTYDMSGAILSKNPFDPIDLHIARFNAEFISPPHTVASLKKAICKVEGIINTYAELFVNASSESPMDDQEDFSVLINTSMGLTATLEAPIALVDTGRVPFSRLSFTMEHQPSQIILSHANGLKIYKIGTSETILHRKITFNRFIASANEPQRLATFTLNLVTETRNLQYPGAHLDLSSEGDSAIVSPAFMASDGRRYRWAHKAEFLELRTDDGEHTPVASFPFIARTTPKAAESKIFPLGEIIMDDIIVTYFIIQAMMGDTRENWKILRLCVLLFALFLIIVVPIVLSKKLSF